MQTLRELLAGNPSHMALAAARYRDPLNQPLADAEHRAYARETVGENPLRALAMLGLVPGYQLAKLLGQRVGMFEGATPESGPGGCGV